jgi:DNA-directed RNA polymerase subunit M/transcription elongation factor TFIIS
VNNLKQVTETFVCNTCGETLPIDLKVKGNDNKCKPCRREYDRKRRQKIKEEREAAGILQKEPIPIGDVGNINEGEKKEEPKETEKKATAKEIKEIKGMTSGLLVAVFGIASTRAGSHWAITESEADSIASPLINILNKYDLFKKVTKNVDALALIAASASIIIPRTLVTMEQRKEKKQNVKRDKTGPTTARHNKTTEEKRENKNNSKGTNGNGIIPDTYILAASGKEHFQPSSDY